MLYKILTSQRCGWTEVLEHVNDQSSREGAPETSQHIPTRRSVFGHPLEAVQQGPVNIAAEISKQVDECPSNGYLLDSSIQVPKHFLFRQQLQLLSRFFAFPCVTVSGFGAMPAR